MTPDELRAMLEPHADYSVAAARQAAINRAAPALLDLWAACERLAVARTPDDDHRARISILSALKKLEAL